MKNDKFLKLEKNICKVVKEEQNTVRRELIFRAEAETAELGFRVFQIRRSGKVESGTGKNRGVRPHQCFAASSNHQPRTVQAV